MSEYCHEAYSPLIGFPKRNVQFEETIKYKGRNVLVVLQKPQDVVRPYFMVPGIIKKTKVNKQGIKISTTEPLKASERADLEKIIKTKYKQDYGVNFWEK